MTKKNRIKAAAQNTAQTKEQVQTLIKKLGDNQRDLKRVETKMNDEIAKTTERYKPKINQLKEVIKEQQKQIQPWCEANREEICEGKKTANLITGKVSWRIRPPSVRINKAEIVIQSIKTLNLNQFLRSKDEINKEALLANPAVASTISGVSITTGKEDFIIEPFEQTT